MAHTPWLCTVDTVRFSQCTNGDSNEVNTTSAAFLHSDYCNNYLLGFLPRVFISFSLLKSSFVLLISRSLPSTFEVIIEKGLAYSRVLYELLFSCNVRNLIDTKQIISNIYYVLRIARSGALSQATLRLQSYWCKLQYAPDIYKTLQIHWLICPIHHNPPPHSASPLRLPIPPQIHCTVSSFNYIPCKFHAKSLPYTDGSITIPHHKPKSHSSLY